MANPQEPKLTELTVVPSFRGESARWSRFLFALPLIVSLTAVVPGQTPTPVSPPTQRPEVVIVPPTRINVAGYRQKLALGQLFIPDFWQPARKGKLDIVVFFHGADWVAEQTFYSARKNAVLVTISLKDYREAFSREQQFQALLDETVRTVAHTLPGGQTVPHVDRICLASFSGGYTAVREILGQESHYRRVTDLILADSLYCEYVDPDLRTTLRTDQLSVFRRFARDAAKGRKRMWFTHLFPPEEKYRDNTTTRTASYLIEELGGVRRARNESNALGMTVLYSCDLGSLHIIGYSGMTHQDHFNHFYNIGEYFAQISFARNSR